MRLSVTLIALATMMVGSLASAGEYPQEYATRGRQYQQAPQQPYYDTEDDFQEQGGFYNQGPQQNQVIINNGFNGGFVGNGGCVRGQPFCGPVVLPFPAAQCQFCYIQPVAPNFSMIVAVGPNGFARPIPPGPIPNFQIPNAIWFARSQGFCQIIR